MSDRNFADSLHTTLVSGRSVRDTRRMRGPFPDSPRAVWGVKDECCAGAEQPSLALNLVVAGDVGLANGPGESPNACRTLSRSLLSAIEKVVR